jgi:hypothetical protein
MSTNINFYEAYKTLFEERDFGKFNELLKNGLDVNIRDEYNTTLGDQALINIKLNNDYEVLTYLLNNGFYLEQELCNKIQELTYKQQEQIVDILIHDNLNNIHPQIFEFLLVVLQMNNNSEKIEYFIESAKQHLKEADTETLIWSYKNLAYSYIKNNNLNKAEETYLEMLSLSDSNIESNIEIAIDILELAINYQVLGKFEKAKQLNTLAKNTLQNIISSNLLPYYSDEYKFILYKLNQLNLYEKQPLNVKDNYITLSTNIDWILTKTFIEDKPKDLELYSLFDKYIKTKIDIRLKMGFLDEFLMNNDKNQTSFSDINIKRSELFEDCKKELIDYNKIHSTLKELEKIEILQQMLDVIALETVINTRSHISIVSSIPNYAPVVDAPETLGGYYMPKEYEVAFHYLTDKNALKATFIHELWHKAMYIVFDNKQNPYFNEDTSAKQVYEAAIFKTLNNFANFLNVDTNITDSTYQYGSLIMDNSWYNKCLKDPSIKETYKETFEIINTFLPMYLGGKLFYVDEREHAEFIVRYEQLVAEGFSNESLEILTPLKEYIDIYVKPHMEEYVDNHPMRHLLISPVDGYIDFAGNIPMNATCAVNSLVD